MTATCTPMTLYVGPEGCHEGECEDYVTEDGEPTGIKRCTHLTEEQYCARHSVETSYGDYDPAEPWPCKHMA